MEKFGQLVLGLVKECQDKSGFSNDKQRNVSVAVGCFAVFAEVFKVKMQHELVVGVVQFAWAFHLLRFRSLAAMAWDVMLCDGAWNADAVLAEVVQLG